VPNRVIFYVPHHEFFSFAPPREQSLPNGFGRGWPERRSFRRRSGREPSPDSPGIFLSLEETRRNLKVMRRLLAIGNQTPQIV